MRTFVSIVVITLSLFVQAASVGGDIMQKRLLENPRVDLIARVNAEPNSFVGRYISSGEYFWRTADENGNPLSTVSLALVELRPGYLLAQTSEMTLMIDSKRARLDERSGGPSVSAPARFFGAFVGEAPIAAPLLTQNPISPDAPFDRALALKLAAHTNAKVLGFFNYLAADGTEHTTFLTFWRGGNEKFRYVAMESSPDGREKMSFLHPETVRRPYFILSNEYFRFMIEGAHVTREVLRFRCDDLLDNR